MMTKRVTIRIPPKVYKSLEEIGKRKPHLSLNAVIIEALLAGANSEKEKARS